MWNMKARFHTAGLSLLVRRHEGRCGTKRSVFSFLNDDDPIKVSTVRWSRHTIEERARQIPGTKSLERQKARTTYTRFGAYPYCSSLESRKLAWFNRPNGSNSGYSEIPQDQINNLTRTVLHIDQEKERTFVVDFKKYRHSRR